MFTTSRIYRPLVYRTQRYVFIGTFAWKFHAWYICLCRQTARQTLLLASMYHTCKFHVKVPMNTYPKVLTRSGVPEAVYSRFLPRFSAFVIKNLNNRLDELAEHDAKYNFLRRFPSTDMLTARAEWIGYLSCQSLPPYNYIRAAVYGYLSVLERTSIAPDNFFANYFSQRNKLLAGHRDMKRRSSCVSSFFLISKKCMSDTDRISEPRCGELVSRIDRSC